jgi:hypothetical protein
MVLRGGHDESMEVRIREAGVDDCPALAALHLRTALFAYGSIIPPEAPRPNLDHLILDWERRLGDLKFRTPVVMSRLWATTSQG